jgi:recombination protein RecA
MAKPKKNNDDSQENTEGLSEQELKIQQALSAIRKQFGDDAIQRVGGTDAMKVKCNTTGISTLDLALGGGLPEGRIIEIYGGNSSGKTSLVLEFIAQMQSQGKVAAFIDVEHALDPAWAAKLGVNTDDLLISQPNSGEEALEIMEALVRTQYVHVVVLDSVAALVTKKELEGDMGDAQMGGQAKLMSQALRKLTASISKSSTTAIFINQIRDNIGGYGAPTVTSGGKGLPFYATIRMELKRIETIKEGDVDVANRVKIKVVKNKIAPPFRTAEYDLRFDSGIDKLKNVLEHAIDLKLIEKGGAWYNYGDKKAQGMPRLKELFINDPELYNDLLNKIKSN